MGTNFLELNWFVAIAGPSAVPTRVDMPGRSGIFWPKLLLPVTWDVSTTRTNSDIAVLVEQDMHV